MIDIYLCEDEEIQLSYFQKVIEEYLTEEHIDARVVSARRSPEQTLADIQENGSKRALFLIDIQLRGCSMDGFGLARELKKLNREYYLVYLTSHEELAYKVFEYELGVLDYIVKSPRNFLSNKISDHMRSRFNTIFEKIEKRERQEEKETIVIECGSRYVEVIVEDIIFIQAIKGRHQIEIHTPYQTMNVRQSLKDIYEMLDDNFLYVNKSCIVQKSMIREIDKKERIVILKGNYRVEISYRVMKGICSSIKV